MKAIDLNITREKEEIGMFSMQVTNDQSSLLRKDLKFVPVKKKDLFTQLLTYIYLRTMGT